MDEPLIGNQDVRDRLVKLAARDRLHHCLLFEGPGGLGKAQTASWLAQLVNCEARSVTEGAPCGECWSCRQIAKGNHPDVIELGLDPERTTPIISVRQARELLGKLSLRPYRARQRLVIIDPADAMTVEAANALLKTFEEPPAATGFVLVTAAGQSILGTVRSRSQRVRFAPVPLDTLFTWLEQRGVPEARAVAHLADGCPGRALQLAESGLGPWRDTRDQALRALAGNATELFAYSKTLSRGTRPERMARIDTILDALSRLLRDALIVHGGAQVPLFNQDCPQVVQAWADALGPQGIGDAAGHLEAARADFAANVAAPLAMDALFTALGRELGAARRVLPPQASAPGGDA